MMLNLECCKYMAFTLQGWGQCEWNAPSNGPFGGAQIIPEVINPTYHHLLHSEKDLLTTTKHPLKFKNKFSPMIR